ncbi:acyl carrier protein [Streptomyces sp. WI04-05B]|uniref:acyl carrier protein n=1 Tax=Streptomyces TaxID=1883 RepID=UPI0029AB16F1|nr:MULTISPECIES: acyl carrier protein [unclassified Streptomyces]MDX2543122.1 acyl carrier protein [Streptomyces sp. WI04-05B]MDX2584837.1 acyl carrier protein [Streptomyces sp. WI04-05A]
MSTSTGASGTSTATDTDTGADAIPVTGLTTDSVRELLSDRKVFPGLPDDLGEDAELVLDSLGLVWLLHVVEERYSLVVEPTDEDIAGLTSLRRLTDYLRAEHLRTARKGGARDDA